MLSMLVLDLAMVLGSVEWYQSFKISTVIQVGNAVQLQYYINWQAGIHIAVICVRVFVMLIRK